MTRTVDAPGAGDPWADHAGDPILDTSVPPLTAAFESYADGELGYRTEQPYRVLARDVSRQWDWDAARGEGGLGLALSSLQDTLLASPQTKVFVANGRYDLVTPYFAIALAARSACVPAAVRDAIRSAGL